MFSISIPITISITITIIFSISINIIICTRISIILSNSSLLLCCNAVPSITRFGQSIKRIVREVEEQNLVDETRDVLVNRC